MEKMFYICYYKEIVIKVKDMKSLTNTEFQEVLKSFTIEEKEGVITIQDEVGEFATFNIEHKIEDTIWFSDEEYSLTEEQKNIIAKMLINEHVEFLYQQKNAFSQEDYSHFTNLIFS